MRCILPPDASDVLRKDIALETKEEFRWKRMCYLSLLGLFLGWVPLVLFISGLASLDNIKGRWPWLYETINSAPSLAAASQGAIASVVFAFLMAIMPIIMLQISRRSLIFGISAPALRK